MPCKSSIDNKSSGQTEKMIRASRIMNAAHPLPANERSAALASAGPKKRKPAIRASVLRIEIYTIDGSNIDCSFMSIAQCAATASGQSAADTPIPTPLKARLEAEPDPPSPPRRAE